MVMDDQFASRESRCTSQTVTRRAGPVRHAPTALKPLVLNRRRAFVSDALPLMRDRGKRTMAFRDEPALALVQIWIVAFILD